MKEVKLSATRISTFLQCKLRYWLQYVKKTEKMSNPSFKLGTACHEALEFAGNLWMKENLQQFSEDQKQDILKAYSTAAAKEGILEYAGYLEGRDLVLNRINNFSLGRKIVGLEIRFGFDGTPEMLTPKGISLIGAIDKCIEYDDDTLLIVDYKTSKTAPDANKLKADTQLSMYNLIVRQLFPEYKRVILGLDMLRKGEVLYTYRTDEELEIFEDYLSAIHAAIMELKEEDALPNINVLCGWCDFRNVCEKYQAVCNNRTFHFLQLGAMNDTDLIEEWNSVRSTKKILETRESDISDVLINKIKMLDEPVKSEKEEMVLRQTAKTGYNAVEVSKVIPYEDFAGLVSLSSTKLVKYLDKNPRLRPFVEELAETNYNHAFLATKKIKVVKAKKGKE